MLLAWNASSSILKQNDCKNKATWLRSFIKRHTTGTSSNNEWQRVVQRVTTNDSEWQRMTTSETTSDNEWYSEWQRVTANDNEWYNEWQRVTTNDNEWYNEWQQVVQRVTTNDNEWQRVTISANFSCFQIREEPTTKHSMEKSLKRTFGESLLN